MSKLSEWVMRERQYLESTIKECEHKISKNSQENGKLSAERAEALRDLAYLEKTSEFLADLEGKTDPNGQMKLDFGKEEK